MNQIDSLEVCPTPLDVGPKKLTYNHKMLKVSLEHTESCEMFQPDIGQRVHLKL